MTKVNPEKAKIAGSTLTSAIIHNNRMYVIQIGDSKAIACDENGKAVCLTTEHKPGKPEERERIENAGGKIETIGVERVEGVLAVSRYVFVIDIPFLYIFFQLYIKLQYFKNITSLSIIKYFHK